MRKENNMTARSRRAQVFTVLALAATLLPAWSPVAAGQDARLCKGQTVYVPAYSHVYHGDREHPFYVAATLSIRNTDPGNSITIQELNYYDSKGQLLKKWLEKPAQIGPQSSEEYIVKESDRRGGFGAHFIVQWKSAHEVSPPLVECVIIGTSGQQGISFASRGQTIKELH